MSKLTKFENNFKEIAIQIGAPYDAEFRAIALKLAKLWVEGKSGQDSEVLSAIQEYIDFVTPYYNRAGRTITMIPTV